MLVTTIHITPSIHSKEQQSYLWGKDRFAKDIEDTTTTTVVIVEGTRVIVVRGIEKDTAVEGSFLA